MKKPKKQKAEKRRNGTGAKKGGRASGCNDLKEAHKRIDSLNRTLIQSNAILKCMALTIDEFPEIAKKIILPKVMNGEESAILQRVIRESGDVELIENLMMQETKSIKEEEARLRAKHMKACKLKEELNRL